MVLVIVFKFDDTIAVFGPSPQEAIISLFLLALWCSWDICRTVTQFYNSHVNIS